MDKTELRKFILSFEAVEVEHNEQQNIEIFRIDLGKLAKIASEKIEQGGLGEFEQQTQTNILQKFNSSSDHLPIFAVMHAGDFPVQFEIKTGPALAKILREKESVVPSKILNERDWNKIIGFGQVSAEEAQDLIRLSYRLASEQ